MENDTERIIDEWVENLRPQIRESLKHLLDGASVISFQCGEGKIRGSNGAETSSPFFAFFTSELNGIILQNVANGIRDANERQKAIANLLRSRIVQ
jgi:hypothetical protein